MWSAVISCNRYQQRSQLPLISLTRTRKLLNLKHLGLKKKSMSMSNKKNLSYLLQLAFFHIQISQNLNLLEILKNYVKKKKIIWKTSPSLSHTLITKCLSWCLPGQFSILFPPLLSLVCLLVGLVAQLQQWLTYVIIINSGLHLPSARLFCQV